MFLGLPDPHPLDSRVGIKKPTQKNPKNPPKKNPLKMGFWGFLGFFGFF
jgi:hypothetical protein